MRSNFEKQLNFLNEELICMGNLCEQVISLSIRILTEDDESLAKLVNEKDKEIDQKERDIEGLCIKLILHQQPVATDLRKISSALKMISDMERIGDQAADIAQIAKYIVGLKENNEDDIKQMAHEAVKMVSGSIESFVKGDLELAHFVQKYDDVVDKWFLKIKKELIKLISQDNSKGEYYIDLLMIAKYLERIADHATNISEWVEYSLTGVRV